jgi:hypothetical protein
MRSRTAAVTAARPEEFRGFSINSRILAPNPRGMTKVAQPQEGMRRF